MSLTTLSRKVTPSALTENKPRVISGTYEQVIAAMKADAQQTRKTQKGIRDVSDDVRDCLLPGREMTLGDIRTRAKQIGLRLPSNKRIGSILGDMVAAGIVTRERSKCFTLNIYTLVKP